jgi:hypothetical protein
MVSPLHLTILGEEVVLTETDQVLMEAETILPADTDQLAEMLVELEIQQVQEIQVIQHVQRRELETNPVTVIHQEQLDQQVLHLTQDHQALQQDRATTLPEAQEVQVVVLTAAAEDLAAVVVVEDQVAAEEVSQPLSFYYL